MKVTVLAFATASDALGSRKLEVELPDGSVLADLARELERSHPALGEIWERLALAVDGELAAADTALTEGCEVALLPPVSGGGGPRVELVRGPIQLAELVERARHPGRGATVVFTGSVRDRRGDREVTRLTYEGYPPMAERVLERICDELERSTPELELAITHRLGEVAVAETSIAIVATAPHRAAAFDACREALERIKREVPIWKREHYADGSAEWREEERLSSAPELAAAAPAQ